MEKHFSDVKNLLAQLDSKLGSINSNMQHYGYDPISKQSPDGALDNYIRTYPDSSGQYSLLVQYLKTSLVLTEKINALYQRI